MDNQFNRPDYLYVVPYHIAYQYTNQLPSTNVTSKYFNALWAKKATKLTDIPYFKEKKPKKTKKPTRLPKFMVFILLPYFTKSSAFYKVILPTCFTETESCVICGLVPKFWRSPKLTMYDCYLLYNEWIFLTACSKQCAKIGNKLRITDSRPTY